jgi:hypothetical protein
MLAEIAAANAAFGIIKQAISNGKELSSAASAIAQFVGAKEGLQRKIDKKGSHRTDLEEFMALEQLREREEELKQLMIYTVRPGLWSDWQKFQAKARVARREAEVEAARKRQRLINVIIIAFFFILGLAIMGAILALALHAAGKL